MGKICFSTGFFGFYENDSKPPHVLVTNYHVIGSEEAARKSLLKFEVANIEIELKQLLVPSTNTYTCSNIEKVGTLYIRNTYTTK